jgi:hypothetical protein
MAPENKHAKDAHASKRDDSQESSPEWANGLRQLYDSVVDEPLPDSFNDLLAQFDEETQNGSTDKGRTS